MELLARREDQEVWLHELTRPYALAEPFGGEPYVCILFANDEQITVDEQWLLSKQIVRSGCLYAVCAGHQCGSWDDSIDEATVILEVVEGEAERFVMTTWHEQQSVEDVIHYGLVITLLGEQDFRRFLVLFVGPAAGLREEIQRAIQAVWFSSTTPKPENTFSPETPASLNTK